MKVMVLGLRGLSQVQGGVETHALELYRRLAALGCDVEVLARTPFVPAGENRVGDVRVRRLWCPQRPGLEAMIHSLIGVVYAAMARPDILHIHAVGPSITTPLARLAGLRTVVTHHGADYDRDKWGRFARWVLRTGERFGMRYSDARIAISSTIVQRIRTKYGREADLIPNGVEVRPVRTETDYLVDLDVEPRRYVLNVARMVPEKRHLDLIRAFARAQLPRWKLVLAGKLTDDRYSAEVRAAAAATPGVILAGYVGGASLEQLYSHAGVFVLPSSHEGLPIALLEALSYGLPALASDIAGNREVGLEPARYFAVGDIEAIAMRLTQLAGEPLNATAAAMRRRSTKERYDWDRIAQQTLSVYTRCLDNDPSLTPEPR
jgi:glycosyltransferase involved in cell wall biosynthesis